MKPEEFVVPDYRRMALSLDWHSASYGERLWALEVLGYAVFPNVLDERTLASLTEEFREVELETAAHSPFEQYSHRVEFGSGPTTVGLLRNETIVGFLRRAFGGDSLVCSGMSYLRTTRGYEGTPLHTDSQPYGSVKFGAVGSSPTMIRVLYYIDDVTATKSPFLVVPASHLSMDTCANPYQRYETHPAALSIECSSGGAIVLNQRVFHAVGKNSCSERRAVAVSLRPGWAKPAYVVDEPSERLLQTIAAGDQAPLRDRNRSTLDTVDGRAVPRLGNSEEARGLGPDRWT